MERAASGKYPGGPLCFLPGRHCMLAHTAAQYQRKLSCLCWCAPLVSGWLGLHTAALQHMQPVLAFTTANLHGFYECSTRPSGQSRPSSSSMRLQRRTAAARQQQAARTSSMTLTVRYCTTWFLRRQQTTGRLPAATHTGGPTGCQIVTEYLCMTACGGTSWLSPSIPLWSLLDAS